MAKIVYKKFPPLSKHPPRLGETTSEFLARHDMIEEVSSVLDGECDRASEKSVEVADALWDAGYRKQIKREEEHGKWHIMPEDPYDESGCPTEEGWYRIITADGEESTDYYFNKPTMTGNGVVFWRNSKKVIRAWAKTKGAKQ